MNFLAHIYLSFGDDHITLGNFIADSVKGTHYKDLPQGVQHGVLLHREIDQYTDSHPIARKGSRRLFENHGHYSRVIIDIFYDHFLAKNWRDYSDTPLREFTTDFYRLVDENFEILPGRVQQMMPYMMADNWLLHYGKIEGIRRVLSGMSRRAKHTSDLDKAVVELMHYYDTYESEFTSFFGDLIIFSRQKLKCICED